MTTIERLVTSGTFELDGGSWNVDNNIWLVGDDSDVVVFDAAHQAVPIVEAVRGRKSSPSCAPTGTTITSQWPLSSVRRWTRRC